MIAITAMAQGIRAGVRVLLALALILSSAVLVARPAGASDPERPLTISMSASPSVAVPGQYLTYTITMGSTSSKVTETRMTDQLNGLTNIVLTSSRGYCFESNLLVTCEGGTLSKYSPPWVVTIRGLVTMAAGESINNTATLVGRKSSKDPTTATTEMTLTVAQPTGPYADLWVALSAPADAAPDSVVPYIATINNTGAVNATGIQAVITLPLGFSVDSQQVSNLFSCSFAAPTINCTGGALDAGTNATLRFNVRTAHDYAVYETTASVDPENHIPEQSDLNNTASHEIYVPAAPEPVPGPNTPPSVVKSGPTVIRAGDVITYTVKVTNHSTKYRAEYIKVTDGTQGLDAASVTATVSPTALGAVCRVEASQVYCDKNGSNLKLDKGKSLVITIAGRVIQSSGSVMRNTATLETMFNKQQITRTSGVSTTVRPGVDLTVTQVASCAPRDGASPTSPWGHCPFRARDQFNHVITVGNSGLDDANDVVVREPLAAGVVFEGFTAPAGVSCSDDPQNVVTCTGLSIPGDPTGNSGGNLRQLVLHLTAPNSAGPISHTVTVDPYNAIFEGNETNNTFSTTTPILTGIDLVAMNAVNFDPVAPSGTLVYSIILTNPGTADVTGVKVRDILPAGTRFRSAKEVPNIVGFPYTPPHGFSCAHDGSATGGEVVCTGGHLKGQYAFNGGPKWKPHVLTDTATIEVTLFAPAPVGPVLNQELVDPDGAIAEIDELNNLNLLETDVQIPTTIGTQGTFNELTVSNVQTSPAAGASVAPNGTLEYTLTVKNHGSDPASNISVHNVIPVGARFRSANSSPLTNGNGGFICNFNAGIVECSSGALASGGSATIVIRLFAPDAPSAETNNYTNHAVIDPGNAIPEADETNNVSDVLTTVAIGGQNAYNQLTITTAQSAPNVGTSVAPNGTLVYRVVVGNTGSDRAANVIVHDYLPAGTTFRSARLNPTASTAGVTGFVCFHSNGLVECRNGTLPAAGMAVIEITLFAPAQPGIINNQAVVDPANLIPEGNEDDNTAISADTKVEVGGQNKFIELSVTSVDDNPDPVDTDKPVTYTVKVRNDGTDDAFNVVVEHYLPAEMTFVSADDAAPGTGAFTCSSSGSVVSCTGGFLAGSGGTRTITVVARAPRHSDVTLINNQVNLTYEARIDPGNAIPEGDETNNMASTTTKVRAVVDLLIVEQQGTGISQGSEGNWKFSVKNSGPDPVTDVLVETSLPVGVIPLDVEVVGGGGNAWSCEIEENPINKVTCLGSVLGSGVEQKFNVRVYTTSSGTLHSTSVADPYDTIVETDESNNSKQGSS